MVTSVIIHDYNRELYNNIMTFQSVITSILKGSR